MPHLVSTSPMNRFTISQVQTLGFVAFRKLVASSHHSELIAALGYAWALVSSTIRSGGLYVYASTNL